ncbi:unnamed protein product [marine sediment metagenome]|uniref:DEAD/DEAH-box helicase domain-containing protein n=1 Tax=marine sediment metagenome TaxID=412755 RepID=X1FZP6_9ZZZZ
MSGDKNKITIFKEPRIIVIFLTSFFLLVLSGILIFLAPKELPWIIFIIILAQFSTSIFFPMIVGYFHEKFKEKEAGETIWRVFREFSDGGILRVYKERNVSINKAMKIKNLKNYGIPSYIINILKKNYSNHLFPLQEDAVKKYGILNCGENEIHPHPALSPQGRGKKEGGNERDKNLLVIAPTSSGKTFIGEMAAIAQAIHLQKTIYLVPLRALADEKYIGKGE